MMNGQIKILDESVINRIAAGEAVSRPAAVIKELVENALDAEARTISIVISDAGKTLIVVQDDGVGMSQDDLKLSIVRHATSKITTVEDLEVALTMGFRGEALASVAAVSDLTIRTGRAGEGTEMSLIDGHMSIRPASFIQGTQVRVQHLFKRIPARLKFLRHNRSEILMIQSVIKAVALSRPDVEISLKEINAKGEQTLLRYTPEIQGDRIRSVMGDGFHKTSVDVNGSDDYLELDGRVSSVRGFTKSPGDVFLFVNGRPVRSAEISKAVREGFGNRMAADRHPQYALYLRLSPDLVDVNAHPTKMEVRFRDIHEVVQRVKNTIAAAFPIKNRQTAHPHLSVADLNQDSSGVTDIMSFGDVLVFRQNGQLRGFLKSAVIRSTLSTSVPVDLASPLMISSVAQPADFIKALASVGILCEPFGQGAVVIRSVPQGINADPQTLVAHLKECVSEGVLKWALSGMSDADLLTLGKDHAREIDETDIEVFLKRRL